MLTVAVMIYLLILSVHDLREKSLPVRLLLAGAAVIGPFSLWKNGPLETAAGCIPGVMLLVISLALPRCLGMGDGLAVMTVGAAWGLSAYCRWMLLGFVLAAATGLWQMLFLKRSGKEEIPLLPFLLLAATGECLI